MNGNRGKVFRVGNFNLCNLALPNEVFYRREFYSKADYARKIAWSAQQLDRMRADIVGFQEVFHPAALQDVLDHSEYCRDFHLLAVPPLDDTPTVALASRFPVLAHEFITDFPAAARLDVRGATMPLSHFSRPVLKVRLQLSQSVECVVYVVHLKSKRGIIPQYVDKYDPVEIAKGQARSLMLRAAEAIALRVLMLELLEDRDYPVMLLGDLNDGNPAVTSRIISGEPPHRRLEHDFKREIWDVLLYHAKDIQARQSYDDYIYTHLHNGHYECLDHIMVSQEFVSQNPERIGNVIYVSVFNDHLLDETLSDEHMPKWQSDHGQLVAAIELERDERPRRVLTVKRSTEVTKTQDAQGKVTQHSKESILRVERMED